MSERNCVNCRYWWWDSGHGPLSDVTPGADWESWCDKKHWDMDGANVTREQFRAYMNKANGCADYDQRSE